MRAKHTISWHGNAVAQDICDRAYKALKPKKKKRRNKRQQRADAILAGKQKPSLPWIPGRVEYKKYIRSKAWGRKRRQKLNRVDHKCEECQAGDVLLHVHHLTYAHLGSEEMDELQVLCEPCHLKKHPKKKAVKKTFRDK